MNLFYTTTQTRREVALAPTYCFGVLCSLISMIIMLSYSTNPRSMFFNDQHQALVLLLVLGFGFFVTRFLKNPVLQDLAVMYLVVSALFFKTSTYIEFIFLMEVAAYLFLSLIILTKYNTQTRSYLSTVFILFAYNFIGTFVIYLYIIYISFLFGTTSNAFEPLPLLTLFTFILKIGFGPWFLWNHVVYESISIKLIIIYIGANLLTLLPLVLLLLKGNEAPVSLLLMLFIYGCFFTSKQLFRKTNLKLLLLFSSFFSLFFIFLVTSLL